MNECSVKMSLDATGSIDDVAERVAKTLRSAALSEPVDVDDIVIHLTVTSVNPSADAEELASELGSICTVIEVQPSRGMDG